MLSVYDGRECIGHLMLRGRSGVEAFDSNGHSLGLFPDQQSAAVTVFKRGGTP
jgi:hypothetical protein